ncbi:MAG: PD-(D/E)XK nuclease family protein [Acidimicrobiales bacterium]
MTHPSVILAAMQATTATRPHPAPSAGASAVVAGAGVVERLRGRAEDRPAVDPGWAPGLREWLEDGLAEAVAALPEGAEPVRITKEALNQVLVCEAHVAARRAAPRTLSAELVRGTMVDALFRQWTTTGEAGDLLADALGALSASGDPDDVAGFVAALPAARRRELAAELDAHMAVVTAHWPVLPAAWLARTQERLLVPLCGGRVVLSGVVDLALGAPSTDRASVCIVEVKSGRRRVEHRGDLHLYALLETLRSGAPPFRVATFYTTTGELDVEPVGRDALLGALHRILAGATRLCRLAAGAEPVASPNPLCSWCSALPACAPGQERVGTDRPEVDGGESRWASR